MIKKILLLICFPFLVASQTSDFIHVDQFGYRLSSTKVAVISNPQVGFNASQNFTPSTTLEVRNATTNSVVFTGTPTVWNNGSTHNQSGDKGWWFDFTSVTQAGEYYIYDVANNEASAVFAIQDNVYEPILRAATKMFYYNRCGISKTTPFVLPGYEDSVSFLQDANTYDVYDQTNTATTKDMSGGWFDAGDYNKYVTFAESAVHNLLWAYQQNPTVFGDNWNIPESNNGIPDILDEIKWETDWLLKMVNTDGSVHIKMGARNYSENAASPPSSNTETRYYAPVCTSSALAAASMLAHAAKVFEQYPSLSSYSQELEDHAILAWDWVLPYLNSNSLQENCDDISVVAGDADRTNAEQRKLALNAAIYLFDLTGDNQYHQYLINNTNDSDALTNNQWSNYNISHIDALLHYTTLSNGNSALQTTITNSATTDATNNWNNYFEFNTLDLYRGYTNDWTYHWGSNLPKANMGNLNLIFEYYTINASANPSYILKAKENLHYFHGVNPLGMVHLSNMYSYGAENSVNQLYHNWFYDGTIWDNAVTSTYGPAPGFVTGGCNSNYTANTTLSPPYNQPLQKSYLDFNTGFPDNSWEISEPAIYYQAAYVRLLSRLVNLNENTLTVEEFTSNTTDYKIYPNPTSTQVAIASNTNETITVSIYDISGKLINTEDTLTNKNIDVTNLQSGVYFLKVNRNSMIKTFKLIKTSL
ncbi:glycoside hydrolase family 9 protein [Lacinutrix salivirga]